MWLTSLLHSPTPTTGRGRPLRLAVEPLECRSLPSFLAPVAYPAGSPSAVAVADFNGDGKSDIVTNGMSVLLGNGDGTFRPAQTVAGGVSARSVAVGDVNGDGKVDVVTESAVVLGNGDGTFQPPKAFSLPDQIPTGTGYTGTAPLSQSPVSVAVGDLNGDGKLDLVVTGETYFAPADGGYAQANNYANVLLGNGDGTFAVAATTDLGAGTAGPVALGDFNHDGRLDVAALSLQESSVAVLLGSGDGTLQPAGGFAAGYGANSLVVGDLNRDGKLDLATSNYFDADVSVVLGNGDGTFRPAQNFGAGYDPIGMTVGDFNNDGKPDLAVGHGSFAAGASVLLGNGDGSFRNPLSYDTNSLIDDVTTGDFNGDGFPDLAAACPSYAGTSSNANTVSVLLNAADWSAAAQPGSLVMSGFPSSATAGTPGSFTLTVKNPDGTTATDYTGTVHFTSSDGRAVLPADYTFTAVDAGVHAFSATLKTAGTQSITASDTTLAGLTVTDGGIGVSPAAASTVSVTGFPSATVAGAAGSFTVTLRDAYGNVATGYAGTVHFTSTDARAGLPADYTFTAADAGVHTFGATLRTAGTQSITAGDTTTAGLAGTEGGILVKAAAASRFVISAPSRVTAGVAFGLTVTVEDAYGNVVTGYTGTIHFSSSDGTAGLPADYTFTAADAGVHTFTGLVLRQTGQQTIAVADTLDLSLKASVVVSVLKKK